MIQYRLTNLYNFWQWNHGGSGVIRGPGVRLRPKAYSMGNQCPGRLQSPSLAGLGIWGGHSRASQRTCPISTACCGCKCNRVVTWFCMSTFQLMSAVSLCRQRFLGEDWSCQQVHSSLQEVLWSRSAVLLTVALALCSFAMLDWQGNCKQWLAGEVELKPQNWRHHIGLLPISIVCLKMVYL